MQQDTPTRVHAVVTALVTGWTARFPTFTVLDGPRAAQDVRDTVIIVGVSTDETGEAYGVDQDDEGLGGRPVETGVVHCELSTWSGDTAATSTLRAACVAALGQLDLALRADSTLGGACDAVSLGQRLRWYLLQSEDGPGVGVAFDVTWRAWL